MKFSRLATENDFIDFDVQYDHFGHMGVEVKTLIEQDKMRDAIHLFASQTGLGIHRVKVCCAEYQKYVFAKRDFEDGKMVFVSY